MATTCSALAQTAPSSTMSASENLTGDSCGARPQPLANAAQSRKPFAELYRLFRREKPDLVHAHMPISGFLARAAAKAAGVPKIAYTCHGFLFNQPGPWARRATSLAMERAGGLLTDVFLTVSEEEASRRPTPAHRQAPDSHRQRPRLATNSNRIPKSAPASAASSASLRTALSSPRSRASSGTRATPNSWPPWQTVPAELWVVGERLASDHGEDMEPYFANAGLGGRLRRLGYRTDVAAILAASDIFVLPSHFEGLPMSIIEAMLTAAFLSSRPTSAVRANKSCQGETGLLVPPAARSAPLAQALLQPHRPMPALRARLRRKRRTRPCAVTRFEEHAVVTATLDALSL